MSTRGAGDGLPESTVHFAIETARPEDVPAMVGLLQELFTIEQDFAVDAARQARGLAWLLGRAEAHVAVARDPLGRVVGMATAQLVISTSEGAPSAWIEDVVVERGYRHHGLGRRLMDACLAWAVGRGATRAQLVVDLGNEPALQFYDHTGWQRTRLGVRRHPLGAP